MFSATNSTSEKLNQNLCIFPGIFSELLGDSTVQSLKLESKLSAKILKR